MRRAICSCLAVVMFCIASAASKGPSSIVLEWPEGKPLVRFTLGKFTKISSVGSQQNWTIEVAAENLWTKPMSANFSLYAFDANKARVGDGVINLNSVAPHQTVKFAMYIQTIGVPTSITIQPTYLPAELRPLAPPKQVSTTIYSVPAGASLKVDGKPVGTTPIAVKVSEGKHDLEFSMPGYHTGRFPLVIAPEQLSGGTVTFELGGVSYDTVELRDGTVINGDVQYVNATQVAVTVGGELHAYDRNLVKRILLVQREAPAPPPPSGDAAK
jgi:PEGA domain